jgi:hypothetical protein
MAAYYFRVPRYAGMPHLSTMLDSIGNDRAVAKLLGLSPRTIAKYRAQGQAPRPVMFALFWETPWGTDLADCIAVNDARRAYGELSSLKRQNAELRRQLASLESELCSNQVAANATFFRLG